ncbi:MAG: bifunctional adenosylcobinamide kinase/adenosylcobinamide-phosphate guanylyltransferase [Pseudomonadota bacterium]|nr:bifunctional adenosylcobinamide kinase/adenosylcobinamide-phosphate guanylyltransferase [Pseudomonadota bacterium]
MTVELVLGGARSGKSRYALQHAHTSAAVTWIATAQAFDPEMQQRIAQHQAERPTHWQTLEVPFRLSQVLAERSEPLVVIDCLTLWLSNWLCQDQSSISAVHADWLAERTRFLQQLERIQQSSQRLILVSNEVGFGIVPDNPLARRFRDEAGRLHQMIAAVVGQVTLVVAGLPMSIKPATQGS